jgi:hypothetical protein
LYVGSHIKQVWRLNSGIFATLSLSPRRVA